jgi:uncharacterized membrane protein YkvI
LAVRRADTSMTRIFDFFAAYGPYTWMAICLTFGLFTIFGAFIRFRIFTKNIPKKKSCL